MSADNIRVRVAGVNTLNSDNSDPYLLGGKSGQAIVSAMHGTHYTSNARGNVYIGSQAATGVALPAVVSTTQQCGLFNPLGSGVNLSLIKLNMGFVSGTCLGMHFVLGYKTGCGASIATGSAGITVATLATPISARLDGKTAGGVFMSAGITTAAPALLMTLGISQLVMTPATTSAVTFDTDYEFDGTLIVPPGSAIFVAGAAANEVGVYCISLIWEELPAFA
jgi:hypothetical protein